MKPINLLRKVTSLLSESYKTGPESSIVNIVTESKGWVLYHWAEELQKRLPYVSINGPIGISPIDYFIPYYLFKENAKNISIAFFTHCEEGNDERSKKSRSRFFEVSRLAKICVSQNKKYAKMLEEYGAKRVEIITPGVDQSIFTPKLRLGWLGRHYWSGRKNQEFLEKLERLNWIEMVSRSDSQHWSVNGDYAGKELSAFLRSLDYVLITSNAEGGPMSLIEGLASGIPVIIPKGVGLSSHFDDGLHTFEKNNFDDLLNLLNKLWQQKKNLSNQVIDYSMENWAQKNHGLFINLLENTNNATNLLRFHKDNVNA